MACDTLRCSTCGRRFPPDPRTGERQKTCSKGCRRRRRNVGAKRRRNADVEAYREAERERQKASRSARRTKTAGGKAPVREGLSRAGLSPEPLEIVKQIARDLRQAAAMSRAAFARQAADIIEERLVATSSERQGRVIDKDAAQSME